MIERGVAALYRGGYGEDGAALIERILRAALNDPAQPERQIDGQRKLAVVDGETVIVDG